MYVWDLVRVLRRRWYVAIPGLLITIIAAGLTVQLYPPSFQATGSVLLISPSTTGGTGPDANQRSNPYLNFGAPLGATADVVSAAVDSDRTVQRLRTQGATGTYQVALNPTSSAPLMSVEATAGTSTEATATLNAVISEISSQLGDIQDAAGSPRNQYIRAQTVTVSPKALPVHGSLIRALAVIGLVGLLGSCGGAVIVEGISRGRGRKQQNAPALPDNEAAVETDEIEPASEVDDRVSTKSDDAPAVVGADAPTTTDTRMPVRTPAAAARTTSS